MCFVWAQRVQYTIVSYGRPAARLEDLGARWLLAKTVFWWEPLEELVLCCVWKSGSRGPGSNACWSGTRPAKLELRCRKGFCLEVFLRENQGVQAALLWPLGVVAFYTWIQGSCPVPRWGPGI